MFIQTLIVAAALVAAPPAQTPPRATPETPTPTADKPQADQAAGVTGADATFVKKAAEGGMAEVSLAKLAQEKASNADVKSFAAKLEKDHSKANDDLKELASKKSITLAHRAVEEPPGDARQARQAVGCGVRQGLRGAMLESHQKGVRDFSNVASGTGDADVKAFASKTLPTLKEHLQQAQDLSKSIGAKKPTS